MSLAGGENNRTRLLVFAASAVALLLVGAAVGILLSLGSADTGSEQQQPSQVDIGFAQDMSTHHLQAVQMANWERDHTKNAELRQLSFDIEQGQLEQVGRMKGWLSMWGQPEQGSSADRMSWMSGGHGGHGGDGDMDMGSMLGPDGRMPGMASQDDLADLRSKSGKQLDVLFLQLMLRHHQGGTPMARYALEHGTQEPVRTLARSILTAQGNEIELMKQLLADRGAKPLPSPN